MGKIILGMVMGIGLLIGVIFIGFGVVAVHSSSAGSTVGDSAASFATPATSAPGTISVAAPKLWADYHANEVAADNEYKGKQLNVQGQVTSIIKDAFDDVYVLLATSNEFEPVRAEISNGFQSEAANLQIGQMITINCQGGGMIVGDPELRSCSIQRNVPSEQRSAPDSQPESQAPQSPASEIEAATLLTQNPTSDSAPVENQSILPTVLHTVPAEYTDEGRRNKLEGTVQLVLLVDQNGDPQNVTVARPLGMGLDESAVAAVKQYKFKPAVDAASGKQVPAQVSVNVQFRLE